MWNKIKDWFENINWPLVIISALIILVVIGLIFLIVLCIWALITGKDIGAPDIVPIWNFWF